MNGKVKRYFNIKRIISILCLTFYVGVFMGSNIEVNALENNETIIPGVAAYFDKGSATKGEYMTFWVDVTSQTIKYDSVKASFKCDGETFGQNNIILNYDSDKKAYKATFKITDDMPSGKWSAKIQVGNIGDENCGKLVVKGTSRTIADYKPMVEWIKLNKSNVNRGESFVGEVKLSNTLSKVDGVVLIYKEGYGSSSKYIPCDGNSTTLKGAIPTYSYEEAGLKELKEIRISTEDYDEYEITNNSTVFKNGNITYNERTTPVAKVTEITMDKVSYNSGEIAKVKVKVENHRETNLGINLEFSAFGYEIYSNSSRYIGNGLYEVDVRVPYYSAEGYNNSFITASLSEVKLIDANTGLAVEQERSSFDIKMGIKGEGEGETISPIFKGVSVNKKILLPGEALKVEIDANDGHSYISNMVLEYRNEKTKQSFFKEANLNRATGKYEMELDINDYLSNGLWQLYSLEMSDINANYRGVERSNLINGDFEVKNSKQILTTDTPVIKSITTDKVQYSAGEVAKITVDVDSKGIEPISVNIILNKRGNKIQCIYNKSNNKYEAFYKIKTTNVDKQNLKVVVKYGLNSKTVQKEREIKVINNLVGNVKPTIDVNNKITKIGNKFDILQGVKAFDIEEGDISNRVSVCKSNLDLTKPGVYEVTYLVTDTYGNRVTKTINVTVENGVSITALKTDKPTNQFPNSKIKVSAEAFGDDLKYEFFVKPVNGQWKRLSKMKSNNYAYWTPTKVGEYVLRVRVKYDGSTNKYDDYKDINFTIREAIKINTLTTNKASESKINEKVKVKATSNVKDALYQFYVKDSSGKWTKLKGMGPKNYAYWTPTKKGNYTLRVRAKYSDSGAKYEAYKDIKFTVSESESIKISSLTTNKPSGTKKGTKITITAGPLVENTNYEFYVKGSNDSKWTKLKGMGPKNYAYWTPKKAGKYTIRVRAKNIKSSANYDSYKDITFTIK